MQNFSPWWNGVTWSEGPVWLVNANGRKWTCFATQPIEFFTETYNECVVRLKICYTRNMLLFNTVGRKDLAIEMYKKGIEELEKGIAVEIAGSGKYCYYVFVWFNFFLNCNLKRLLVQSPNGVCCWIGFYSVCRITFFGDKKIKLKKML